MTESGLSSCFCIISNSVTAIDSDWKFKIKFGYENNEEISSLEKKIRWAFDELGLIPNEKVERMFLKKYLKKQGRELPDELKDI